MMIYLNFIFLTMLILMMMLLVNLMISKKMFKNREKNSPFECGFDPISMNRLPFSMSFYLISMIFLIFDIEITIILPMIYMHSYLFYLYYSNMLLILLILLIGLYLEWKEGALKWFK